MIEKKENIYVALCKMQAELTAIEKKRSGYNFKYADLSDIWTMIRKPLSSNGFSLVQLVQSEEGSTYIITKLMHISGECIESKTLMEFTTKKIQDVGSAITYYRRYALSSMLAIVSDQDVDSLTKQEDAYQKVQPVKISAEQLQDIETLINGHEDIRQRMLKAYGSLNNISVKNYNEVIRTIQKLITDKAMHKTLLL